MELNFKNLSTLKDPKDKSDFFSSFLDDRTLFKYNPDRYEFYLKYISGLSDPKILKKFFYKDNKIKTDNLEKNALIDDITNTLRLLGKKDKKILLDKIKDVYQIDDIVEQELINKMENVLDIKEKKIDVKNKKSELESIKINEKNTLNDIDNYNDDQYKIGGYGNKLPTYDEPIKKLNKILESHDKTKISKEIRTNPLIIDKKLDVTLSDKFIFIGITFVLRVTSLFIIEWALNANVVNNFFYALIGYCCFYILLFLFLVFLVNVIFYYPVLELYTDYSIVDFPNMLYYLYVYNDGYYRILIHLAIISLLLILPFILDFNNIEQDIKYDYKKKQEILTSISNFSFIIWILTSLIAIKF